jgi:hypothetical protein
MTYQNFAWGALILDLIFPISDIELFSPISDHFDIGLDFDFGLTNPI